MLNNISTKKVYVDIFVFSTLKIPSPLFQRNAPRISKKIARKGHLLFSAVATTYILVAVKFFEELDLVEMFGEKYEKYMAQTPSYCPLFPKSKSE